MRLSRALLRINVLVPVGTVNTTSVNKGPQLNFCGYRVPQVNTVNFQKYFGLAV